MGNGPTASTLEALTHQAVEETVMLSRSYDTPCGLWAMLVLPLLACSGGVEDTDIEDTDIADPATTDPLSYHDGYWVGDGGQPGITIVNDMHIDLSTRRATVYAQMQAVGQVVSPPQVGPGECTTLPSGDPVCFHPNAVYLNGSGVELDEADGSGEWWVKHSWVVGGEGYLNWELAPMEDYGDGAWVEGELLEDGLTMKVTAEGGFYNLRKPLLESDPVDYEVTRYTTDDAADWTISFQCAETASMLDGEPRPCPAVIP